MCVPGDMQHPTIPKSASMLTVCSSHDAAFGLFALEAHFLKTFDMTVQVALVACWVAPQRCNHLSIFLGTVTCKLRDEMRKTYVRSLHSVRWMSEKFMKKNA
jgi:hypothetical protein